MTRASPLADLVEGFMLDAFLVACVAVLVAYVVVRVAEHALWGRRRG